jgi:hypothetical protein
MKSIPVYLLLALSFLCNGCMTSSVMDQARPVQRWNSDAQKEETMPGQSSYYALLPLSIPADIVTSPFQIIGIAIYSAMMRGH